MNLTQLYRINDYQTLLTINDKKFILTNLKRKEEIMSRKNKIREFVFIVVLVIFIFGTLGYMMYDALFIPKGYYAPDYVENGVLYDIDGDGDYYHWVDPE